MEDRLERLEEALAELQRENRELRADLDAMQAWISGYLATDEADSSAANLSAGAGPGTAPATSSVGNRDVAQMVRQFRLRGRYSVIFLLLSVVLVPILAWTVGHQNAFWSAIVGAVNVVILYFVGPGAYHLLIEGLVRAVPGILLGHTTRIAVERIRNRKPR